MIDQAAADTIPNVAPMFWAFRIMVGLGFSMLALFALAFCYTLRERAARQQRWLLRWALWFLPVPWIAAELGWFVAEYGRQPWTIYGVLPTHLSASTLVGRQPLRFARRLHRLLHRCCSWSRST